MTHAAAVPPYLRNLSLWYHSGGPVSNADTAWKYSIWVILLRRGNAARPNRNDAFRAIYDTMNLQYFHANNRNES